MTNAFKTTYKNKSQKENGGYVVLSIYVFREEDEGNCDNGDVIAFTF